ncbi:hypothetical protein ANN_08802 [Periplaneta americana]|uniref:DDE Tnp4 domain-containing protein n=1 Tax=Periplaneta americana TaxID=6978 RepID=A0ABQ8T4Q3_PERAM|nr:hypothetical protein ANN_08802 [Periplaneta americana]
MEYYTRLSKPFLCYAVPEVCAAVYDALKDEYLKFPGTKDEWKQLAQNYQARWQFPFCLGAMDGKHVAFRCLREDGSLYHNYKGTDSIVLLALTDADYKFTYIDIGCNGRISDGGVYRRSTLSQIVENAKENFPQNATIGNNRNLPYAIVADDAFPLQEHITKPYPREREAGSSGR